MRRRRPARTLPPATLISRIAGDALSETDHIPHAGLTIDPQLVPRAAAMSSLSSRGLVFLLPCVVACSSGGSTTTSGGGEGSGDRTEERTAQGTSSGSGTGDGQRTGADPASPDPTPKTSEDEGKAKCAAYAEAARCRCPSSWDPAKCYAADVAMCEGLWRCPTQRAYVECLTANACSPKPPCGSLPSTC